MSSLLVTKRGKHQVNKISDFKFQIFQDNSKGMNVPVTIFANDFLIFQDHTGIILFLTKR